MAAQKTGVGDDEVEVNWDKYLLAHDTEADDTGGQDFELEDPRDLSES